MPLYEYECTACKKHTEKIQKFSDPEITACPHCGGQLKRVITAPAIAFKGGGWYADGYGNAKPASSGEGSSGGESKDGGGGKADSATPTASPAPESKPSGSGESSATPAVAPPAAAPAAASSDKK